MGIGRGEEQKRKRRKGRRGEKSINRRGEEYSIR
jgi:hypothetical protein